MPIAYWISWGRCSQVDDDSEAERPWWITENQEGLIDREGALSAPIPPVSHAVFRIVNPVLLVVLQRKVGIGGGRTLEEVVVVQNPAIEQVEHLQVNLPARLPPLPESTRNSEVGIEFGRRRFRVNQADIGG